MDIGIRIVKNYFTNGKLMSEESVIRNILHGPQFYYYENGIKEIYFNCFNDEVHGIYHSFNSDGSRDTTDSNKNGNEHGPKIEFNYKQHEERTS